MDGAIVGAGIAGLAAAVFARDSGLDVEIFERGQGSPHDQHLIWMAPNGLHLLQRLGLLDRILAHAIPQEGMIFADRHLKPLMTLQGDSLRRDCQYPIVALRRRELWDGLRDLWAESGGLVHEDHALDHVAIQKDRVLLHFEGLSEPKEAPWVIGADGMGSKVRKSLFPEADVSYQGIRTWLGQSETPVASHYVGRTIEAWGHGTRFVLTSLDGHTVHFSALERAPVYEKNSARIPEDTLARLTHLFAEYHPDVRLILQSADPSSLIRCNFGVVSGLDQPYRRRVGLIGDAAHGMPPNMGQGASLGLEDALWVVQELRQSGDSESAFRHYAQGRRARVREMRFLANAMNTLFQPANPWGSLARDVVSRWVPDSLTARRMGQIYQPALPR